MRMIPTQPSCHVLRLTLRFLLTFFFRQDASPVSRHQAVLAAESNATRYISESNGILRCGMG